LAIRQEKFGLYFTAEFTVFGVTRDADDCSVQRRSIGGDLFSDRVRIQIKFSNRGMRDADELHVEYRDIQNEAYGRRISGYADFAWFVFEIRVLSISAVPALKP
jgi:hypothetical protein